MKRINAIVEVRMGSTRLPGKTMMPILGRPAIDFLLERLRISTKINDIIVATTINSEDDVIEEFCIQKDFICYRGSSADVLGRVYNAAKKYDTDIIVEVTGDCPLLDPWLIDECLEIFEKKGCDFLSNFIEQSYPPGIDVQIFSFGALDEMNKEALDERYREHVSLYMLKNPSKFNSHNVFAPAEYFYPDWHLELDEQKDYELICKVYEKLYPTNRVFKTKDIIAALKANLHWLDINKDVKRKWEQVREEEF